MKGLLDVFAGIGVLYRGLLRGAIGIAACFAYVFVIPWVLLLSMLRGLGRNAIEGRPWDSERDLWALPRRGTRWVDAAWTVLATPAEREVHPDVLRGETFSGGGSIKLKLPRDVRGYQASAPVDPHKVRLPDGGDAVSVAKSPPDQPLLATNAVVSSLRALRLGGADEPGGMSPDAVQALAELDGLGSWQEAAQALAELDAS